VAHQAGGQARRRARLPRDHEPALAGRRPPALRRRPRRVVHRARGRARRAGRGRGAHRRRRGRAGRVRLRSDPGARQPLPGLGRRGDRGRQARRPRHPAPPAPREQAAGRVHRHPRLRAGSALGGHRPLRALRQAPSHHGGRGGGGPAARLRRARPGPVRARGAAAQPDHLQRPRAGHPVGAVHRRHLGDHHLRRQPLAADRPARRGRHGAPGLQPGHQPPLRLHRSGHLPAAARREPAADPGRGRREDPAG